MGYRIWRKDLKGWDLAFDTVYVTREDVDERIAELNAEHHDKIKYGELAFYPYRDDIKLGRDGSVIDPSLPRSRPKRVRRPKRRRSRKLSSKSSKALEAGIKSGKEHPPVSRGSFSKYG